MEITEIKSNCKDLFECMVKVRRDLHENPELSEKEFETQKYLINILEKEEIEYSKVADTGIVAIIRGSENGKTVAYRADIDALPIDEPQNKEYASKNKGVMHACGHDAHTAIAVGMALFFKRIKEKLKGNVKIFFQPAEETIGGAKRMIEEGCFLNPKVDAVLGLHVMPYLEAGKIETKYGTLNSSTDTVHIKVKGKSGHAAYPDKSIDVILVMSHIIVALQSVVSRNLSPLNSGVVSITKINGGIKTNIIPDEVVCSGSVRSDNSETRVLLFNRIDEIAKGISKSFGAECEITWDEDYFAPLVNTESIIDVILESAQEVLGKENIVFKDKQSMGGEDFSFFIENVPGGFYHIGCKVQGVDSYELHSREFDIDEKCMLTALEVNVNAAMKLLNQ